MPLSNDVIQELQAYIDKYLAGKEKNPGRDWLQKQTICTRVRAEINKCYKADDQAWLRLINFIGTEAHLAQSEGYACSHMTEMLFMLIHVIRRGISPKALQEKISQELGTLEELRNKYVAGKKTNIEAKTIIQIKEKIDATLKRLAYLGHTRPLLELDRDEMAALFKGSVRTPLPGMTLPFIGSMVSKFYSSVWGDETDYVLGYEYPATASADSCDNLNPYLPYVLLDQYETIFLYRYYNGVRPVAESKASDEKTPSKNHSSTPDASFSSIKHHLAHHDSGGKTSSQLLTTPSSSSRDSSFGKHPRLSITIPPSSFHEIKASEQKNSLVSPDTIVQLREYLSYYTLAKVKKYHFDIYMKINECNNLTKLINDAASNPNTSVDEWFKILLYIGTTADKVQNDGKFCSVFTEVFYLLLHTLRQEIIRNSPTAYAKKLEEKKADLAKLRNDIAMAKIENKPSTYIEQKEKEVYSLIQQLAYLGDVDPLLALTPAKLAKLYTGYFGLWYEFSPSNPLPYNVKEPICTELPLVLDPQFPDMFLNKYKNELATVADAKQAEEQTTKAINDLENSITELSKVPLNEKILASKSHNAKTLLITDQITDADIKKFEEQIGNFEAIVKAIHDFISHVVTTKKTEFSQMLALQTERINQFKAATLQITNTLQEEKKRLKEIAEKDAEEKVVQNIRILTEQMTELSALPVETLQNIRAISTQLTTLDQVTREIQAEIGKVNYDRRAEYTPLLSTQLVKIQLIKNTIIEKDTLLKKEAQEAEAKIISDVENLHDELDELIFSPLYDADPTNFEREKQILLQKIDAQERALIPITMNIERTAPERKVELTINYLTPLIRKFSYLKTEVTNITAAKEASQRPDPFEPDSPREIFPSSPHCSDAAILDRLSNHSLSPHPRTPRVGTAPFKTVALDNKVKREALFKQVLNAREIPKEQRAHELRTLREQWKRDKNIINTLLVELTTKGVDVQKFNGLRV